MSTRSLAALLLLTLAPAVCADPATLRASDRFVDHHAAPASCFDPEIWDLLVEGAASAECAAEGGALALSVATAASTRACDPGSATAQLVSRMTFEPGASARVRAAGNDSGYATTGSFGWAAPTPCGDARLWDRPNAIFVTTNAFPPEQDGNAVLFSAIRAGVSHRVVVAVDESAAHDYRIAWEAERAQLWIDGALRASIEAPMPAGPLPFTLGAAAWATGGGPARETFHETIVAQGPACAPGPLPGVCAAVDPAPVTPSVRGKDIAIEGGTVAEVGIGGRGYAFEVGPQTTGV